MSDGSGEIIIKGGSCEIYFNHEEFPQDNGDLKRHKHIDRKITRVQVNDENGNSLFDKGSDDGVQWTITVSTSNK